MACEDDLESLCTSGDQREGLWPGAARSERHPRNVGTGQSEDTQLGTITFFLKFSTAVNWKGSAGTR